MKGIIKTSREEDSGRHVWVIRHGQTRLNAEDKIRSWIDIPLDDEGIAQAHELGVSLRKKGIEMDGMYSSDLLRSVQTCLIVSEETGIPLLGTTRCLRPWDAGKLSGKDGPTVHKIMMDLAENKPDELLGGDGESFNIFKHRILAGTIGILNANRGLRLGLVSHSRGERALHAWQSAGCPSDLEVDLDEFGKKGEGTATSQELVIKSPLVLS